MVSFLADETTPFPSVNTATEDGLLAIGGDLGVKRLIDAYSNGIFPWFDEDSPILWWSPPERMVMFLKDFKLSKSLKKTISKNIFNVTFDTCFNDVITNCAKTKRVHESSTWITNTIIEAYNKLHANGYAHSVETWQNDKLVGGLYGVSLGKGFFGESMFHLVDNSSKVAYYFLVEYLKKQGFHFIDCQIYTSHLSSLGANLISRNDFMKILKIAIKESSEPKKWNINI